MLNKVQLIGRVGQDPDVRQVNGKTVATVSLATSEYYEKEGNRQQKTYWHKLVLWDRVASVVERFVKKGSRIFVEGKITSRSYEKDGVTHWVTEIVVYNVVLLDNKPQPEPEPNPQAAAKKDGLSHYPAAEPNTAREQAEQGSEDNPDYDPDKLPF